MENQLQTIVSKSGLEPKEGKTLLEKFGNYEEIAKEWEEKAKAIVVTDSSQTAEMAMAKVARKKFSDLRIDVENSRKAMKEQSLRKGQAIDAVARFIVSLISPIENHLKEQENFVKIEAKRKAEEQRIADEKRAEEELRLKEESERKEQERVRLENIKLKEEADKKEATFAKERAKAEADKAKVEEEARKEREESERIANIEKEKADKILAEERAKADKERLEKERVQKLLDEQIECPFCKKKFNIK